MENVKINSLELENVKRIRAVALTPSQNGLTVIGGDNNNGKTSVLDAICWALLGDKYKPATPQREGALTPPAIKIKLSNGLIVERKGKNSSLTVTDPAGQKAGQQLLNSFIEELALNLPKFMNASDKDKANSLLQIIGVGEKLYKLDNDEQQLYQERLQIGRIKDQKEKFASEQPFFSGLPLLPITATELIKQQQDILAKNGENQRLRFQASSLTAKADSLKTKIDNMIIELQKLQDEYEIVSQQAETAQKTAEQLQDESTEELKKQLEEIEETNAKIRKNLDKEKAEEEAKHYTDKYNKLTSDITTIREERMALLNGAKMPLNGLSITEGKLTYNGFEWSNMSGSQQLIVATAIARAINPKCGFVLLDKLEQLDTKTLKEFSEWLEAEGLQAIATRVSKGAECTIIIEDGRVADTTSITAKTWQKGTF